MNGTRGVGQQRRAFQPVIQPVRRRVRCEEAAIIGAPLPSGASMTVTGGGSGGQGQGHPRRPRHVAARSCVFPSLLRREGGSGCRRRQCRASENGLEAATVCHLRPPGARVPPRLAGRGGTGSPPGWPPGSPFDGWPWPAAGGGQGHPKRVGRRAGGRVAPGLWTSSGSGAF